MLKERIRILQQANVISDEVMVFVIAIIDDLLEMKTFDKEKLEMFTTHLAMATQRIINNEMLTEIPDEIFEQVSRHPKYQNASNLLLKIMSKAPCDLPESEQKYILLHLCNLFDN